MTREGERMSREGEAPAEPEPSVASGSAGASPSPSDRFLIRISLANSARRLHHALDRCRTGADTILSANPDAEAPRSTSMATVRDLLAIKGTHVETITPCVTVFDAAVRMNEHKIGALLVLAEDRL